MSTKASSASSTAGRSRVAIAGEEMRPLEARARAPAPRGGPAPRPYRPAGAARADSAASSRRKPRMSSSWPRLWASRATEPISRRAAVEPELAADAGRARALGEAVRLDDAADAEDALGTEPAGAAAVLDLAAHREHGVGAAGRARAQASRATPRASLWNVRAERGGPPRHSAAQPVIVGVVGVDDVDARRRARGAQPRHVAGPGPRAVDSRVERQPGHRRDAGLARLVLEAIPGNQRQPDPVAARAEPSDQPDHGVRAARPPAIGDEVEHAGAPVAPVPPLSAAARRAARRRARAAG